tara:strand:- start:233 stop:1186 length:954 start_codon:yes stop_codon:yes gene_type:complete
LNYKILICGVGSIGERHLNNLLKLGYDDIILYRKRDMELRTIKNTFQVFKTLESALREKPDICFICNPTHLHISTALKCADAGCHLFIEKPLGNSLKDINQLNRILKKKNKKAMVGYMSRFHPCLIKGKEWIEDGRIGKVVFARTQWGEYLPDWHPWEDYRESYAAKKSMGGGPALTLSHEIDTMLWYFGKVKSVIKNSNYNSDLEISCEHSCDIIANFNNGITANIHLDYIQKPPVRNMEIVGTKGRIYFDYYKNEISIIPSLNKKLSTNKKLNYRFERNSLFIDELKHFFHCVKNGNDPQSDISSAMEVVKIALS